MRRDETRKALWVRPTQHVDDFARFDSEESRHGGDLVLCSDGALCVDVYTEEHRLRGGGGEGCEAGSDHLSSSRRGLFSRVEVEMRTISALCMAGTCRRVLAPHSDSIPRDSLTIGHGNPRQSSSPRQYSSVEPHSTPWYFVSQSVRCRTSKKGVSGGGCKEKNNPEPSFNTIARWASLTNRRRASHELAISSTHSRVDVQIR